MFLKVNLLTTSGPSSVGLLYKESVGTIMTEAQFIEAVGLSNVLPGSEALKLAMFVGYAADGIPGVIISLIGAILPPTVIMLTVVSALSQFKGDAWMSEFIQGLSPAVGVLIAMVSYDMVRSDTSRAIGKKGVLIGILTGIALLLNAPSSLVLIGAGMLGVLLLR